MTNYVCMTCGVQYESADVPPTYCRICNDERQYIGPNGQQWTTLKSLQQDYANVFTSLQPGINSIVTTPKFAIGQRAHLVQTPAFNLLWDCISLIDNATVTTIQAMGGLSALALSHPHYYSTIVEWSHAFGGIPIYVHAADREWITRHDPAIHYWEGNRLPLAQGLTLIHCGGHFDGASVLHWEDSVNQAGCLLVGDTITTVADARFVSFMYSYPNLIPLPAAKVEQIVRALADVEYERLYDAFGGIILSNGKAIVRHSADRYIRAISGS